MTPERLTFWKVLFKHPFGLPPKAERIPLQFRDYNLKGLMFHLLVQKTNLETAVNARFFRNDIVCFVIALSLHQHLIRYPSGNIKSLHVLPNFRSKYTYAITFFLFPHTHSQLPHNHKTMSKRSGSSVWELSQFFYPTGLLRMYPNVFSSSRALPFLN